MKMINKMKVADVIRAFASALLFYMILLFSVLIFGI